MKLYPRTIEDDHVVYDPFRGLHHTEPYHVSSNGRRAEQEQILVRVPLPPRSLLILYGAARYLPLYGTYRYLYVG